MCRLPIFIIGIENIFFNKNLFPICGDININNSSFNETKKSKGLPFEKFFYYTFNSMQIT